MIPATGTGVPGSGVPVVLDRDEAGRLARRELADPSYDAEPGVLERVIEWVLDRVAELLEASAGVSPGSWAGLAILTVLLAVAALAIRRGTGPLARRESAAADVFDAVTRSAAEHRRAAEEAAGRGDWPAAVVERFRAVVRSLEERSLLDARAGRTADEAAREGGSVLPDAAAELAGAARVFDGVRYGDRPATADDDARVRAAEEAVRRARPRPTAPAATGLVAPR